MPPAARWTQAQQRAALRFAMGQAGILTQLPDSAVDEYLADALAAVNARAYLFAFGHFQTVAAQPTYTETEASLNTTAWIEPPRLFDSGSQGQTDWSTLYTMPWEFDAAVPIDRVDYVARPLNDDLRKVLTRLYADDTERLAPDWMRAAWTSFALLEARMQGRGWYDRAANVVVLDPAPDDVHRIYWVAKVARFLTPEAVTNESINGGTYSDALMSYAVAKACFPGADMESMAVKVETGTGKAITTGGGRTIEAHGLAALQNFCRILPREWTMLSA